MENYDLVPQNIQGVWKPWSSDIQLLVPPWQSRCVPHCGGYAGTPRHTLTLPSLFQTLSDHKRGKERMHPKKRKAPDIRSSALSFMSPAHAVQLCHNDLVALQRLHSGPYPPFSFMLSPPSSNTFLHKVRVPSFSSLPIHLLIFQRPAYVLLQLLTLHPFALSWRHTLMTRSISHPHL